MTEHYPRIRVHASLGPLVIRESLSINFYMRHNHADVAQAVLRSLETYLQVLGGPQVLSHYQPDAGSWFQLDEAHWEATRNALLTKDWAVIRLRDTVDGRHWYRFDYEGRPIDVAPPGCEPSDMVCAVSFWLPTEYLEEQGPERVRELALKLAAPLPFCSGHAGLSFNCEMDLVGVTPKVHDLCLRYPGMDVPAPGLLSLDLGTRVKGPHWLTFLGPPVLEELGGASGLRARLHAPGTTVQELEGDRAVVTLGPCPEAGDTEQGQTLPAYRELARVLEPWLYVEQPRGHHEPPEEVRRWERRFLD
jgi:hypothetical protein